MEEEREGGGREGGRREGGRERGRRERGGREKGKGRNGSKYQIMYLYIDLHPSSSPLPHTSTNLLPYLVAQELSARGVLVRVNPGEGRLSNFPKQQRRV